MIFTLEQDSKHQELWETFQFVDMYKNSKMFGAILALSLTLQATQEFYIKKYLIMMAIFKAILSDPLS